MNQDIEKHYVRAKSLNEKKIMQRKKSYKEKIDKCSENLKHLSYAEE